MQYYDTDAFYQGDLDQTKSSIIASSMAQTTQERKTFQRLNFQQPAVISLQSMGWIVQNLPMALLNLNASSGWYYLR